MKKLYFLLFFLATYTMSAQLVFNEALYDPATSTATGGNGDANGDGATSSSNDEFLEFVNTGATPLDIGGFKIYDATNFALLPGTDTPRHEVPASTIIPAGGIYVVFGGGDASAIDGITNVTAHTASSGSLSMTNTNEVMTVTDSGGTVLITLDSSTLSSQTRNSSLGRNPSTSGDFTSHQNIDGKRHSPGELQTAITNTFSLVLNEIHADPDDTSGDANGDANINALEDQFLEFFNNSGGDIDITGYKFYDFSAYSNNTQTPDHVAPTTVITDNEAFVIFGGGTPTGSFGTATVQTASAGSLDLSPAGPDTIFVTDGSDNLVFIFEYLATGVNLENNESATRSPDVTGGFSLHTSVGTGLRYSPGLKIDGTTLSNESFEALGFKMYPNPVKDGLVHIKSKTLIDKNIELFDVNGRSILQTKLKSDVLDVSVVKSGFYVLKVSTEDRSATSKLIIK
tara:strand:- start:15991 stop:17358 length:1368 start_codon:yes stop_codon:yes gene_type:complete